MPYAQARGVAIPLNPDRPCAWRGGSFHPDGPLLYVGDLQRLDVRALRRNPVAGREKAGASARLFVGFNVDGVPRWSMNDLVPIVERVRIRQTGDPNATFLFTRGLFRSATTGNIDREDGAQVIIIDEKGRSAEDFELEMVELAEVIAAELQQEKVYVEVLHRGIPEVTIKVIPV